MRVLPLKMILVILVDPNLICKKTFYIGNLKAEAQLVNKFVFKMSGGRNSDDNQEGQAVQTRQGLGARVLFLDSLGSQFDLLKTSYIGNLTAEAQSVKKFVFKTKGKNVQACSCNHVLT